VFVLRHPVDDPIPRTIDATMLLVYHGMTMLRGKRAIEAMLDDGGVIVELPLVEDPAAVIRGMAQAGIEAIQVAPGSVTDVRGLRERLNLTREQFALRYGLEIEAVRDWEAGEREPDTTARSYLRVIASAPGAVERAYASAAVAIPAEA
jgi:putative transcriptional regulator